MISQRRMVKVVALLLTMLMTTNAFTYEKFYQQRQLCEAQKLRSCIFQPINTSGKPLTDQWLECAQDYEKSNVCFYGYSQCLPKEKQNLKDEMPLVCWNCYLESPSQSENYKNFRECLGLAEPKLLLSFALTFLMLLAFL